MPEQSAGQRRTEQSAVTAHSAAHLHSPVASSQSPWPEHGVRVVVGHVRVAHAVGFAAVIPIFFVGSMLLWTLPGPSKWGLDIGGEGETYVDEHGEEDAGLRRGQAAAGVYRSGRDLPLRSMRARIAFFLRGRNQVKNVRGF